MPIVYSFILVISQGKGRDGRVERAGRRGRSRSLLGLGWLLLPVSPCWVKPSTETNTGIFTVCSLVFLLCLCGTVICNKKSYLVFVHCSWHGALKALVISYIRATGASFVIILGFCLQFQDGFRAMEARQVSFGKPLDNCRTWRWPGEPTA